MTILFLKDPNNRIHKEACIDLVGGSCEAAADYTKRPYVFQLKLVNGAKYLFQAKDEVSHISYDIKLQ